MNQEAEVIADELVAVSMTAPKFLKSKFRRLTGFTILDEKEDMHIRPFFAVSSSTMVRCKLFGPITKWCITGYDAERPSIWVKTKVASYFCDEPNTGYLPLFQPLYMKTMLCIHASQFLKEKPSEEFGELFKKLVPALMANFEIFKDKKEACNFADSHLDFIAQWLIEHDMSFFSNLQAIKTMIDVCVVDIRKAGNRMARFPYFMIYRKNEPLHKYCS
ncbi:hypothetical protein AMTRI_Chr11g93390 [Amborella trichopoda]